MVYFHAVSEDYPEAYNVGTVGSQRCGPISTAEDGIPADGPLSGKMGRAPNVSSFGQENQHILIYCIIIWSRHHFDGVIVVREEVPPPNLGNDCQAILEYLGKCGSRPRPSRKSCELVDLFRLHLGI